MSTEAELRADLDRATRALERADATASTMAAEIHDLRAQLARSGQELATWKEAAVARMTERDQKAAALFRTDNLLTSALADRDALADVVADLRVKLTAAEGVIADLRGPSARGKNGGGA